MDLAVVDYETFYDKDYSLSKLSTAAYIQSPQFRVIGAGIKINEAPTVWRVGEQVGDELHRIDWNKTALLAHNSVFDCTILTWKYGIKPKLVLDTLSLARAVHGTEVGGSLAALAKHYGIGEKGTEVVAALGKRLEDFTEEELKRYGEYCVNDVELTYELFKRLAPHFSKKEIQLIDMTIRMHSEPSLQLDKAVLEENLEEIRRKKEQALQDCGVNKEDLMSNNKFAEVLRGLGVEPPTKISPRTGKETYAFAKKDEELLSLLEHDDLTVQTVVAARLQTKETLEETKTIRLIETADVYPLLPVGLKYYGAEVTGRFSAGGDGGALQLQNIARTSRIKEAIVAPDGYVVVGFDLSNIEVRVNLYLAGQMDQLDVIRSGTDMYRVFGSKVFGVPYDEIDKQQRFISKTAVLGLGFGASAPVLRKAIKLGSGVDVGEEESIRIVSAYRDLHPNVVSAWRMGANVIDAVHEDSYYDYCPGALSLPVHGKKGVQLPSGMFIKYPGLAQHVNDEGRLEWSYEGRRGVKKKIYSSKILQNCTQSVARCVMSEAMVRINKRYRIALTVHDSCAIVVPESEAETAYSFMLAEMTKSPEWAPDLPLAAEGGIGKNLKECM
jgi:DNA polymerase I-like protein with 3'-5' exonuclease and polymerase domains